MSITQVLQDTPRTLEARFYADGVLADDPGTVTVTATKADGTAVATNAATTHPAVGVYRYNLARQAELNLLKVVWNGQVQTQTTWAEIIGSHLFTLAQFRGLRVAGGTPFANVTTWPNEQIEDARAEVLDEFTDILGFSPVTRYYRETISVGYGGQVILAEHYIQRILSVTVAGTAQTVSNFYLDSGGILQPVSGYTPGYWTIYGSGVIAVEYAAGWPRPKGDAADVAMLRAAMKLDPAMSAMASTVTTPDGSSYSFDAAGQVTRGGTVRHFGVGAIDAWLQRHSMAGLAVA